MYYYECIIMCKLCYGAFEDSGGGGNGGGGGRSNEGTFAWSV